MSWRAVFWNWLQGYLNGESGDALALRRTISWVGTSAILAAILLPPIAFLGFGTHFELEMAKTIASMHAARFHGRTQREPDFTWHRFYSLVQLDQGEAVSGRRYRQSLIGYDGVALLTNAVRLPSPIITATAPLSFRGESFGTIEVVATQQPLLVLSAWIALCSAFFGLAVWLIMHRLPLRMLDQTLKALRRKGAMLDGALNNMAQGLCMIGKDRRLLVCNRQYAQMYDLPDELIRPGTEMCQILDYRISRGFYAGTDPDEFRRESRAIVIANERKNIVHELNDGRVVAIAHQPLPGGGAVSTHEDITEQRQLQRRMDYLVTHDVLTGLVNRAHLRRTLASALGRGDQRVAVLCIDLGRFKEVNDNHGQQMGDALLKAVADRLGTCATENEVVARNEGDRFFIVQIGAQQPVAATGLAVRVDQALSASYDVFGQQLVMEPKIGIAISPADGTVVDDLLAHAHAALQRARGDEQARFEFYERGVDEAVKARRSLEHDLSNALRNGELEVHYQPLVNLERGLVSGCEALMRWKHPQRGWVHPVDFIPIAEAQGLIIPFGEWVLQPACADAATWPNHIKVAVNLSTVQFKSRQLVQTVADCLATTGLAPARLELEITESILLADNDATLKTLHELKTLGVRISMDDFGTGYSSLSYLRSFPFDKIKIDRCFINDMKQDDPNSRVIVRAVARLGTSLGIATLAEGIETQQQLDLVRAEGCVEGQGYFFGRPEPAAEVSERLRKQSTYVPQHSHAFEESVDAVRSLHHRDGNAGRDEERRIQALYELNVLDTAPEEAFDRITRIARVVLQAPIAMISLVDRDRQWFKSRHGVEAEETPRHFSFCTHTIQQDVPLVVSDALLDARFSSSPLVRFGPKVRSYIGVPLRMPGGHNIGALCINDVVPRDVKPEQIEILQDLARLVVDELQLRKIAFTDSATGVMTTRCFHALANRRIELAKAEARHLSCIMIDIDGFKSINDLGGHAAGDRVLAHVAAMCAEGLPEDDLVGRLGGDEFAILLMDANLDSARLRAEALRAKIDRHAQGILPGATASFGVSLLQPEDGDIKDLLAKADKALYAAKRAGRNRVEVHAPKVALPNVAA